MEGLDCVKLFGTRHELPHHELLALLRGAIDGDGFAVYGEAVVELATGDPIKHELRLRLPAPDGSLIPLSGFYPVAERFGLMAELDELVIRRAAALAAEGHAVAVDVHPGSVSDPDLARRTEQALADATAAPELITFELCEESLTSSVVGASAFAQRMHALGCRITADEFGTGSAGFGYLKRLPLDCLKIDACFIEGMQSTPSDEQFVRAFVHLARGLGLTTAADGVLDDQTRAILQDAGIDEAQGTFFGGPVALVDGRFATSLRTAPRADEER